MAVLHDLARQWIAHDPDPATCAELEALLEADDMATLGDRFDGRLVFGTAGIRGEQGGGPNRMNRVTVRRMGAGVAEWLDAGARVVIGFDARTNSDIFAADLVAVLTEAGHKPMVFSGPVPTPVLAFAVRHLACDLGLMVTASHNPPSDNGCKVFLADGAQLRAPIDTEIDALIDRAPIPSRDLALVDTPIEVAPDVVDAYIAAIAPAGDDLGPTVAYTPLHGVGWASLRRAFASAGLAEPVVVPSQAEPDPAFPTVSFPNPEEPGAMDALLATADAAGADLAIANDPDADRFAAAVRNQGSWRILSGDEVGAILGDEMLQTTAGSDRVVVSTVVCSSLVSKIAASHGVAHRETLTGFKWIMHAAYRDELRPVFAYEESLGYALSPAVRDKDGISAAIRFVQMVSKLEAAGSSVVHRLAEIAVTHGVHATRSFSIRFDGSGAVARANAAVDRLRAEPPSSIAGLAVTATRDYNVATTYLEATNLLRFDLDGGVRVLVRPSGTEPKAKVYLEQVAPAAAVDDVDSIRVEVLNALDAMEPQIRAMLLA